MFFKSERDRERERERRPLQRASLTCITTRGWDSCPCSFYHEEQGSVFRIITNVTWLKHWIEMYLDSYKFLNAEEILVELLVCGTWLDMFMATLLYKPGHFINRSSLLGSTEVCLTLIVTPTWLEHSSKPWLNKAVPLLSFTIVFINKNKFQNQTRLLPDVHTCSFSCDTPRCLGTYFVEWRKTQSSVAVSSYVCVRKCLNILKLFLTLILQTWRIWRAPNNASRWQLGFNSAFKGLKYPLTFIILTWIIWWAPNNASRWQMDLTRRLKG